MRVPQKNWNLHHRSKHPDNPTDTIYMALRASQVIQWVKNLPAMQETQGTWARSLGREDPLEEGVVTHFSILARRIAWTEEPGGLTIHGVEESRAQWTRLSTQACTYDPKRQPL